MHNFPPTQLGYHLPNIRVVVNNQNEVTVYGNGNANISITVIQVCNSEIGLDRS